MDITLHAAPCKGDYQIVCAILREQSLSHKERIIAFEAFEIQRSGGRVTQPMIAEETGCGLTVVHDAIRKMKQIELVTVTKVGPYESRYGFSGFLPEDSEAETIAHSGPRDSRVSGSRIRPYPGTNPDTHRNLRLSLSSNFPGFLRESPFGEDQNLLGGDADVVRRVANTGTPQSQSEEINSVAITVPENLELEESSMSLNVIGPDGPLRDCLESGATGRASVSNRTEFKVPKSRDTLREKFATKLPAQYNSLDIELVVELEWAKQGWEHPMSFTKIDRGMAKNWVKDIGGEQVAKVIAWVCSNWTSSLKHAYGMDGYPDFRTIYRKRTHWVQDALSGKCLDSTRTIRAEWDAEMAKDPANRHF